MERVLLNGTWTMTCETPGLLKSAERVEGSVPGSVYSFLLDAGLMEDPYDRDNELQALELIQGDYTFERVFEVSAALAAMPHLVLRFDGIDTLAMIELNGQALGLAYNMHRVWEFDVRGVLAAGENVLRVHLKDPVKYIREKDKEYHLGGTTDAMRGFPHLRKAHCMFGWDWGARLPDEGIWRDVAILGWTESRIEEVRVTQEHVLRDGASGVSVAAGESPAAAGAGDAAGAQGGVHKRTGADVDVRLTVQVQQSGELPVRITVTAPDGKQSWEVEDGVAWSVPEPQLWWPHGLGEQPLYTVKAELLEGAAVADERMLRIGLRAQGIRRKKDEWGETFAQEINGQTYFAMGADYIPEDHIMALRSEARTRHLLQTCAECGFNSIRVWGGGIYPDDWFYDACDELGLVIWQDMMFACANYKPDELVGDFGFGDVPVSFEENISLEMHQNLRRIRHHASLGLLSGNNEMEQFALEMVYDGSEEIQRYYLYQNEVVTPAIVREDAPEIFYWPSSPSSGGNFDNPRDENRGDVHYWEVWHANRPFTEFRQFHYRYLSEFGFQALPVMETIRSFARGEDLNFFSRIMEMHQRNVGANGKILMYLARTYRYPYSFEDLVYASQLLQAEAIRYGVEHFRRNRNDDRCMGAVYWQLNDIWPVISWASVDYFGRWKALQYAARHFFAPVMISCEEISEVSLREAVVAEPEPVVSKARLCVTNETFAESRGTVMWALRDPESRVILSGGEEIVVPAFSAVWLEEMDFSDQDFLSVHLDYRYVPEGADEDSACVGGAAGACSAAGAAVADADGPGLGGSVLFTAPKHYRFADPRLRVECDGEYVTVTADAYARSVMIGAKSGYLRLEDNFFDMEKGSRRVRIVEVEDGTDVGVENLEVKSVWNIGR